MQFGDNSQNSYNITWQFLVNKVMVSGGWDWNSIARCKRFFSSTPIFHFPYFPSTLTLSEVANLFNKGNVPITNDFILLESCGTQVFPPSLVCKSSSVVMHSDEMLVLSMKFSTCKIVVYNPGGKTYWFSLFLLYTPALDRPVVDLSEPFCACTCTLRSYRFSELISFTNLCKTEKETISPQNLLQLLVLN